MRSYGIRGIKALSVECSAFSVNPSLHPSQEGIISCTPPERGCLWANFYLCVLCGLVFLIFSLPAVYAQDQKQQQGPLDKERLDIIKSDIQKEIRYNEKLKKDIEDAQKSMDEATQQRLLKVSKIYEAMAPEEAAKTLEKLDEDTAAAILGNLKPRKAGAILGQMDSDKSASISKKLIVKNPKLK